MAKNNNLTDFLTDVANAIRAKKGTTGTINPQNFSSEIASISTGVDTSDATATAADILSGKTAYVNGTKVVGTRAAYDGTVEYIIVTYTDCLNFVGKTSDFTLKATNKSWDGTLEWSTDHNTWTTLAGTEAMQSVGRVLYLRGKGNTIFCEHYTVKWQLSEKADCIGNIQTLMDWENPPTVIDTTGCYCYMFADCTNLTTAPDLPATTLSPSCYYAMFSYCTNLTKAPELPATTLKSNCYSFMFNGCAALKVNISSGNKIFTCPSTIPNYSVNNMFDKTGGTFTGTPTAGTTYYYTL